MSGRFGRGFGDEVEELTGHESQKPSRPFGPGRAPELSTKWNRNNKITRVLQYLILPTHIKNYFHALEFILPVEKSDRYLTDYVCPLLPACVENWLCLYPVQVCPSERCWKNERKYSVRI